MNQSFWKTCLLPILFCLMGLKAQASDTLPEIFKSASQEYGVPISLLQSIAYVETRWYQANSEESPVKDTEHQKVYGVMGLHNDNWFGHSLIAAALLLHSTPQALKTDPKQNIQGAAALLKLLHQSTGDPTDPLDWTEAVRAYSGIPETKEQNLYLYDIYRVVKYGKDQDSIQIEGAPIEIPEFAIEHSEGAGGLPPPLADHPQAEWDATKNFTPGGIKPQFIVIHDTEGSYAGAVSWLKNPASKASAHYIVRSEDGQIKQLVRESDRAWHARCWNSHAIGIEHEGFESQPQYYTNEMYYSSAKLVRAIAAKFKIPLDDLHIFGHDFWSKPRFKDSPMAQYGGCNTHTDPGGFWDWHHYFTFFTQVGPIL